MTQLKIPITTITMQTNLDSTTVVCVGMGIAIAFWANCASAQITPDNTLPNNSTVKLEGKTRIIEQGTRAGGNLFHSFGEFSVPTGSEAHFNNASDIQNIISRVTGKSVSNIDGLIRTNGIANLFLINPSGIIFGKNASLNIGGSFVATTANAIQFGNQSFFSADNPNSPALLTVNPSAFLFNQIAAAPIQNNSQAPAGLNQSGSDAFGLRVADGESLLLVGGNISMDGGRLNAFGGRVELGGLAGAGTVNLNNIDSSNLSLNIPENIARADVSLINGANVDVSAGKGGSIAINARNMEVLGASRLLAGIAPRLGSASSQAGDLTLNATGNIRGGQASRILNIVDSNGVGSAGNLNIIADSLILTDGTQLSASVFGQGNAGNIIIQAQDISFDGVDNNGFSSGAFSAVEPGATGKGGTISITSGSLALTNGARLNTSTFGQGNTGSIIVRATDAISLDGVGSNGSLSGIFNNVSADAVTDGKGGNISVTTGSLSIANGAQIIGATFGQGSAGDITIDADTISLDGVSSDGLFPSAVFSSVERRQAVGNGGNISVTTGSLSITNGARLSASTLGKQGDAGNISIQARNNIVLDGVGGNNFFSGVFNQVLGGAIGNSGNISVKTGSLFASNGAKLTANTFGRGNAGTVKIDASDRVSFDGSGTDASSQVGSDGVGNGGSVTINTGLLFVTNRAQLSTTTFGTGNVGSVTINASDRVLFAGRNAGAFSRVARRGKGTGGSVTINTGSLTVSDGAVIAADNLGVGDAGSVRIDAQESVLVKGDSDGFNSAIASIVGVSAEGNKGGNITINSGSVSVRDGAILTVETRGQDSAGNLRINARDTVSFDGVGSDKFPSSGLSRVRFGAVGNGGNVIINTGTLSVTNGALLDVTTEGIGNAGIVKVTASDRVLLANNAFIVSGVQNQAVGNAGGITINAKSLTVSDGAFLSTTTAGLGDAGIVKIDATDSLLLSGNDTGIFSRVRPGAIGKGGNITITTSSLFVNDEAQITASNIGQGTAGDIGVIAPSIRLNNNSSIQATTASGNGGNINVNSDLLLLRRHSQISTNAGTDQKSGDGGNINIESKFIVAVPKENSDISANAFTGKGGNVYITVKGLFGIQSRSRPTSLSDITASSERGVAGTVELNTPDTDPSRGLIQLPSNLVDASQQIAQGCTPRGRQTASSFIATGRGGLPQSPNEPLRGRAVIIGWVDLPPQATERVTDKLSLEITDKKPTTSVTKSTNQIVEAQGWIVDANGDIQLVAQAPNVSPYSPWQTNISCTASQ